MKLILWVISLVFCLSLSAQNAKERIQNTKQISQGKKDLKRDISELKNMSFRLAKIDSISSSQGISKDSLLTLFSKDFQREIEQSKVKVKWAKREIRQSQAELNSDRRENQRNRNDAKHSKYDRNDDRNDIARDNYNKADDRMDKIDDRIDLKGREELLKNQEMLLVKFNAIPFSQNTEKIALIKGLLKTMNKDIEFTKKELVEDVKEAGEDKRERRDDRQERNENNNQNQYKRRGRR
jgi:hypothetical protein